MLCDDVHAVLSQLIVKIKHQESETWTLNEAADVKPKINNPIISISRRRRRCVVVSILLCSIKILLIVNSNNNTLRTEEKIQTSLSELNALWNSIPTMIWTRTVQTFCVQARLLNKLHFNATECVIIRRRQPCKQYSARAEFTQPNERNITLNLWNFQQEPNLHIQKRRNLIERHMLLVSVQDDCKSEQFSFVSCIPSSSVALPFVSCNAAQP